MAVSRGGKRINQKMGDIILQQGDLLVMDAAEVGAPFPDFIPSPFHNLCLDALCCMSAYGLSSTSWIMF